MSTQRNKRPRSSSTAQSESPSKRARKLPPSTNSKGKAKSVSNSQPPKSARKTTNGQDFDAESPTRKSSAPKVVKRPSVSRELAKIASGASVPPRKRNKSIVDHSDAEDYPESSSAASSAFPTDNRVVSAEQIEITPDNEVTPLEPSEKIVLEEDQIEIEPDSEEENLPEAQPVNPYPLPTKKKTKKTRKTHKNRKSSVVGYFFEEGIDPVTKVASLRCLLSPFATGKHQEWHAIQENTSNAKLHLRSCHSLDLAAMERARNEGQNLDLAWRNLVKSHTIPTKPLDKFFKAKHITPFLGTLGLSGRFRKELALVIWATDSQIAIEALETKFWGYVQQELNFQHARKSSLLEVVEAIYTIAVRDGEALVQSCPSFATTTDLWTSIARDHYLAITYHCISTQDWVLHHRLLDLVPFPGREFSETIAAVLNARIQQHTKQDNIHASSVQDRGANIQAAARAVTGEDDTEQCFNHALHHLVLDTFGGKDGVRTIGTAVVASKDLALMSAVISAIRTYNILEEEFDYVNQEVYGHSLALVKECATRWEGLFRSVTRFLQLQTTIKALVEQDLGGWYSSVLKDMSATAPIDSMSDAFWRRLASYQNILNEINNISKASQSEKLPTISSIPYWVYKLKQLCEPDNSIDTGAMIELKEALQKNLQKRLIKPFIECVCNPLKAALLDPRYSKHLLTYGVSADIIDACWESIVQDCLCLTMNENESVQKIHEQIIIATLDLLKLLLQTASLSKEESPLDWWKSTKSIPACFVPVLLQIPAGGAASERSFSSAGGFVTPKRNRLGVKKVEQFTVIRHFLKQPSFSFDRLVCLLEEELHKVVGDK